MDTLKRRAVGFQFRPNVDTAFDIEREHPDLLRVAAAQCPGLPDVLAAVRRELPLPPDALPDHSGHFYRLPGHTRSFCYAVTESEDKERIFSSPAIVVKGAEPLLPDFARLVEWMRIAPHRLVNRRMADHFALAEGKVPGALTASEALRDAHVAAEVQIRHLGGYGELAPMPVPLLVSLLSSEESDRCLTTLRGGLSEPGLARIEPALRRGLAVYVYYYRAAPIRSSVWGSGGSKALIDHVKRAFNEEAAIRGWARLMVRLLYLGYLPFTSLSEGLGACMDFGNATIDGGVCDPDSIVSMSDCPDDHFFVDSLVRSLQVLNDTCARLVYPIQVVAPGLTVRVQGSPSALVEALSHHYLLRLIREFIESEARPGLTMDPRVLRVLAPASFAELTASAVAKGQSAAASYALFAKSRPPRS